MDSLRGCRYQHLSSLEIPTKKCCDLNEHLSNLACKNEKTSPAEIREKNACKVRILLGVMGCFITLS